MGYLHLTCRFLLLGVFLAALWKLRDRAERRAFLAQVRGMRLLPAALTLPMALAVSSGEVAVVVLLLVPGATRSGFALAALLLVVFTAVAGLGHLRGMSVPCRCFGRAQPASARAQLCRDGVLTLCAVTGLLTPRVGSVDPAGLVTSAIAAVAAVIVAVSFLDLVAFVTRPSTPGGAVSGQGNPR